MMQSTVPAPAPPNGATAIPPSGAAGDAWRDLAKNELGRLLTQVRHVDAIRAEAERLHRALTAYGMTLDPLPWVAPRADGKRHHSVPQTRVCARCSERQPVAGNFTREGLSGTYYCKDTAACAARKAA